MTSLIKSYFNDLTGLTGAAAQALPGFSDDVQNLLDETRVPENRVFAAATTDQRVLREQRWDDLENGPYGTEEGRRRKKEKEKAADVAEAMADMAQEAYVNAMQDARGAVVDLGKAIDKGQEELDLFNEELDKNTIVLSDGTKAYFNEETKRFEKQDEQDYWHELDEEQEEEAQTEFARKGFAGTKQDKMKADARQADIDRTRLFRFNQKNKLDDIERRVDNGDLSHSEGETRTKGIERETEEAEKDFTERGRYFRQSAVPAVAAEQNRAEAIRNDQFSEDVSMTKADDDLKNLFGNSDTTHFPKGQISAANPEITVQENISNPFMQAAKGEPVSNKPPAPDIKESPDMDVAAFTRSMTSFEA